MKKTVTFSDVVQVVTEKNEIKYEKDWWATSKAFDYLGQFENLDFIQQQFEDQLSILGKTGKKDLESLQEATIPFCSCTSKMVKKMGAVEYLKLLAKNPEACGTPPSHRSPKAKGIAFAPLANRKGRKKQIKCNQKDNVQQKDGGGKRGTFRPKEIPGRDSAEQRKMRIMAGQHESKLFEKYAELKRENQQHQQDQESQVPMPISILKTSKNNDESPVIIDLTFVDDQGLFYESNEYLVPLSYDVSWEQQQQEEEEEEVRDEREPPMHNNEEERRSSKISSKDFLPRPPSPCEYGRQRSPMVSSKEVLPRPPSPCPYGRGQQPNSREDPPTNSMEDNRVRLPLSHAKTGSDSKGTTSRRNRFAQFQQKPDPSARYYYRGGAEDEDFQVQKSLKTSLSSSRYRHADPATPDHRIIHTE